jgi:hypothetical protein
MKDTPNTHRTPGHGSGYDGPLGDVPNHGAGRSYAALRPFLARPRMGGWHH